MARIKIECSKKDKLELISLFSRSCPFSGYIEQCGEDTRCSECIKNNVDFVIRDEGDNQC